MSDLGPQDVLFMGMGRTAVAWYRCFLPALALKADWVGYGDEPPDFTFQTGYVRADLQDPVFTDYKIIVIQQPRGEAWRAWIAEQQALGIKVLYDIDDDLHAVSRMKAHTKRFEIARHIKDYELVMRQVDGIIVSTDVLAQRMARFNKHIWVCEAGIDMERYQLERLRRAHTKMIGFAGGYGHEVSLTPWLPALEAVMRTTTAKFMCAGVSYADKIKTEVVIPFTQVEMWPSVLANFDVLLAPGGNNGFFRAKSELKWIEASAMGIPVIASPVPFHSIEHGRTGVVARTAGEVEDWLHKLLGSPDLATQIGQQAREHVLERYHIRNTVEQWITVFEEVIDMEDSNGYATKA